jgi:hypothetical protein
MTVFLFRIGLGVALVVNVLVSCVALACGVSTPDGIAACSLAEHEEEVRPRWHVGASGLYTSTAIRFRGDLRSDETRAAVLASVAYQPSPRLTLQGGLGATFGGQLDTPTGAYLFSPGPTVAVGAAWRAVQRGRAFVVLTGTLSFSAATTHLDRVDTAHVGYQALDLRAGALAGVTVLQMLSPYAVGRVFGGPVFWRYQGVDLMGGDVHHYQIGAGLTVLVAHRVNLFAEGIPLGERAVSGGAAFAF